MYIRLAMKALMFDVMIDLKPDDWPDVVITPFAVLIYYSTKEIDVPSIGIVIFGGSPISEFRKVFEDLMRLMGQDIGPMLCP